MIGKALKPVSVMLWSNDRVLIWLGHLEKRNLQVLKLSDIYLTIVLALTILIGMLAPISGVSNAPAGTDKIIHLVSFASLVFPLARTKRIRLFLLFTSASFFAGIIEVIQPYFGRNADINDWFADIFGIASGMGIAKIYTSFKTH